MVSFHVCSSLYTDHAPRIAGLLFINQMAKIQKEDMFLFNRTSIYYFSPDSRLISGIIAMGIMAPLTEEMAFRGIILTKTRQYSSTWFAIIFSSILFGIWHRNLGQFFPTTIMGIIFALIYIKTGKLRFAMLAHSLSNIFLAIATSSGDSYLPKITLLMKLRTVLLEAALPIGIIGLIVALGVLILLIYKGYDLTSEMKDN